MNNKVVGLFVLPTGIEVILSSRGNLYPFSLGVAGICLKGEQDMSCYVISNGLSLEGAYEVDLSTVS